MRKTLNFLNRCLRHAGASVGYRVLLSSVNRFAISIPVIVLALGSRRDNVYPSAHAISDPLAHIVILLTSFETVCTKDYLPLSLLELLLTGDWH